MTPPAREYQQRLDQRRSAHAVLLRRDAAFSYARLATFAAAAAIAVAAFSGVVAWWLLILPAAAFAVLMQRHDRVIRARDAAARAIQFYEHGLARIEDRWPGIGEPGDRFRDDHHYYANDLDLFGPGSLFQLLSIARTRIGESTLAQWLTRAASTPEIFRRQQAVDELSPALDLRESLSRAGADLRASVDAESLVRWAAGDCVLRRTWLRSLAVALSILAIATAAYWGVTGDPTAFFTVVALEVLSFIPQRPRIQQALHAAEGPARDLDVLAQVLSHIEQGSFNAPRLADIKNSLHSSAGVPASAAIGKLHRLVELHDWQHNQFFAPFAAAVLWGTHLAWAIEGWRAVHGVRVAGWLQAVGEFEALGSLSAYRYEHPDDVWPAIVDAPAATFDGLGLGHPLLPAARMVRNDVHLAGDTRLLIVSGSNMSGKSTLLRTVGINTVLALAGAPVRASSLRLTPLTVGATLRIQDSLQEGRSRFYAEITRLRELADITLGPVPLLFLLDELLHGTNSHDRLVGAAGVLRSFVDRGAIGLITTHDLALTSLAHDLAPRAANVHFEDRFEGGEIQFDYRMKSGPVARSNAIALMRAVGLNVDRTST